jgi:hypothetical protein
VYMNFTVRFISTYNVPTNLIYKNKFYTCVLISPPVVPNYASSLPYTSWHEQGQFYVCILKCFIRSNKGPPDGECNSNIL